MFGWLVFLFVVLEIIWAGGDDGVIEAIRSRKRNTCIERGRVLEAKPKRKMNNLKGKTPRDLH